MIAITCPFHGGCLGLLAAAFFAAGLAAADESPRQADVVFMDKGLDVKGSVPRCHQPASLTREILRQAFLVAARDELGLDTRDAWMGSEMPATREQAEGNLPFDVAFSLSADDEEARIVRGVGRQRPTVKGTAFRLEHDANYLGLLGQAEEASRTRFVAALEAEGFAKRAADPEIDYDVTKRSLEALDHLDEIRLFAALRHFHAIRGGDGVDEQTRLGGLVRGYALLGLLTEHGWHPLSKDLKARALVYAQRMAAKDPESPLGWWHRAYALALTGLHAAALDDLARADQIARHAASLRRQSERRQQRLGHGRLHAAHRRDDRTGRTVAHLHRHLGPGFDLGAGARRLSERRACGNHVVRRELDRDQDAERLQVSLRVHSRPAIDTRQDDPVRRRHALRPRPRGPQAEHQDRGEHQQCQCSRHRGARVTIQIDDLGFAHLGDPERPPLPQHARPPVRRRDGRRVGRRIDGRRDRIVARRGHGATSNDTTEPGRADWPASGYCDTTVPGVGAEGAG